MRREKAAVLPGKKEQVLQYNTILFLGSIRLVFFTWCSMDSEGIRLMLRPAKCHHSEVSSGISGFSHRGHSPPAFAMSPSESPGKLGCRRGQR